MNATVLQGLALGRVPADEDLVHALFKFCDDHHACDCRDCPVYQKRDGDVDRLKRRAGCDA